MHPDQTDPVRENAVFDAAEPTEQEKALIEQGLQDDDSADGAAAGAEGADAGAEGAPDADAQAAAAAEEQRQQQEQQEAAERERQAAAAREAATAEAQRNQEAIAAAAAAAERPAPPKDFDAEFEKLAQQLDDGDLEQPEYQRKLRDLTKEEAAYATQVTIWEADQKRAQDDAAAAQQRAENAWNTAALQWEADNADFMSNALRAKNMQEAIGLVTQQARARGEVLPPEVILSEAQKIAFEYSGYTPPEKASAPDPKAALKDAMGNRKPPVVPQTLGNAPSAGAEQIRGNEGYGRLDSLPITDLEEAVQRMPPDQLEAYLLDAPGAKAHGRGDDLQQ